MFFMVAIKNRTIEEAGESLFEIEQAVGVQRSVATSH